MSMALKPTQSELIFSIYNYLVNLFKLFQFATPGIDY